jgi:hypothetical protein
LIIIKTPSIDEKNSRGKRKEKKESCGDERLKK